MQYDEEGGVAYTGVAESISPTTARPGRSRSRAAGRSTTARPVTAESFVDAWNYTAYSPNAQAASYFFANVEGYDDLQAATDDAGNVDRDRPPRDERAEGRRRRTFTVTLSAPFAQWPVTVGYSAFYPLPESFFDDPEAAGEQPVGNGPFQAEEPFEPGVGITLTRYDDYAGDDKARRARSSTASTPTSPPPTPTSRPATSTSSAGIPADASATAPTTSSATATSRTSPRRFTYLGLADLRPAVRGQAGAPGASRWRSTGRRSPTAIFNGTRTPADVGHRPGHRRLPGRRLRVLPPRRRRGQPAARRGRLRPQPSRSSCGSTPAPARTRGWRPSATSCGRTSAWTSCSRATSTSRVHAAGDDEGLHRPVPRSAGRMDYPSPQNYLEPLYSTAALPPGGMNLSFYSNPVFDQLVDAGQPGDEQRGGRREVQRGRGRPARGHADHPDVLPGRAVGVLRARRPT